MKRTITALSLMASSVCFGQQFSQKYTDINYVGDGKSFHNLDIYLPKTTQSKYPVVVYIYGSAWYSNSGKGADMSTVGAALLDAGFAVVTPNHRSSSDAKFPAQSHDIKAVIRFIRGNAQQYKFDTNFIASSGSSSGGHLASLMGTTNGVKQYTVGATTMDLDGNLGNYDNFSSKVDAVVDFFGPVDFMRMENCNTYKGADSPEAAIIGGTPAQNQDKTKLLSPITYVDPTDPPILIFHGGQDNVVPSCQSQFFYDKFQQVGVESEYVFVSNGQHGPNVNNTQQNLQKMVQFLLKQKNIVTSIDDQNQLFVTKIFPNPFSTSGINIHIHEEYSYTICDMMGHKAEVGHGNGLQTVGHSLEKGIYVLRIHSNNTNTECKIIKQ
jgi:acetyl esterase/lipase